MTYRSKTSRFLAPSLAACLALPAFAAGWALLDPAVAEASVTTAQCRIYAVEARAEGDGSIPAELSFLADHLKVAPFSAYKSFRLIQFLDYKLEVGTVVDKKFKSGHNVRLELRGGDNGKLELHTQLMRNKKSLVSVDFSLQKQVMLIPVSRGDQTVIFAYQCKS